MGKEKIDWDSWTGPLPDEAFTPSDQWGKEFDMSYGEAEEYRHLLRRGKLPGRKRANTAATKNYVKGNVSGIHQASLRPAGKVSRNKRG